MLAEAEARLIDLASAVADGQSLDWETLESSTEDPTERAVIKRLRAIADVGRVHADVSFHGPFTLSESFGSAVDRPALQPGSTWGSLQILEKVGRGRFGDVYRAWDPSLDREVALKLLRHENERAEDQLLVEEGRLMARVRHPNVVTIYGAQRIDGRTGLWMEFVQGRTLEGELRARGPFEASALVTIGVELCRALSAVHDAGLVHRDVKAQNVLRDSRGHVRLGDFGTGRELDEEESGAHEIAGTPAYLAPEVFRHARATPQSDIYSLGALLFHLATGDYPVRGRSLRDLRDAHARGERTPLRGLRPDLSDRLTAAIERALSPVASDRFSNAADMEQALSNAVEGQPGGDASKRPPWQFIAVGSTAVFAIVAVLWLALGGASDGRESGDAQIAADDGRRVMRQISADSNLAGPGVPSPDGRLLSYVDQGELALFDITSKRRWRITGPELSGDPPGWVVHSHFSLDGSRLTYLRFASQSSPARPQIRTISVTGGRSRMVWQSDDGREMGFQHWAGDDDLVLASRDVSDGESELLVISTADGSSRGSFSVPSLSLNGASLSPDGRFVAYERPDPATGLPDIYIRGIDAESDQPLIRDAASDQSPVWTPDGRHLFFISYRSGTSALWMQQVDAAKAIGRPVRIEPNLGWAYPMGGLTRTGALFFRRQIGTRDVFAVDIDPATLQLGGEPERVSAEGVGANGSSAWSPDSTRLAFFRRRDQQWSLIVKSVEDGKEQEFRKPFLEGIAQPRWEGDGRSLLFKASLKGRAGLYRLDVESGDVTTVLDRFINEYELLPQPGVIVYSIRTRREVIRRDLVTGQEAVIHRVPAPSTLVEMGLSNRGDRLAYSSPLGKGVWALRVIDLASPERAREILRVGPGEIMGAYAWSLDDREIIIKRGRNAMAMAAPSDERHQSDESRLWAVDVMTGQMRLVGLNVDGLNQVRMSPDGRRLSFDGGWPFQEVWALEHALIVMAR